MEGNQPVARKDECWIPLDHRRVHAGDCHVFGYIVGCVGCAYHDPTLTRELLHVAVL